MLFLQDHPKKSRHKKLTLRHVLKRVSRSFYLSIVILPKPVREQVCLAYLFCRAADTIADATCLSQDEKRQTLQLFRKQFVVPTPILADIQQLQNLYQHNHLPPGERELFFYLPSLFDFFKQFSIQDQNILQELVLTLTRGMEMDLVYFGHTHGQTLQAFPDLGTLDLYTYYVAGVVGEFWTKIHAAHLPSLRHCDMASLCTLGVHFGKALQLTNILKDLGRDMAHGRCYLPQDYLEQLGTAPQGLQQAGALPIVQPLVRQLVARTMVHLHYAQSYIVALPLRAIRLRLSCLWPLLFALQTLEAIVQSEHLLQPEARVKISRQAVYRTLLISFPCVLSHYLCGRYYDRLRQRLQRTLTMVDAQQTTGVDMARLLPSHSTR